MARPAIEPRYQERTAALRARSAAAWPRVERRELADEAEYSEAYVKSVLSNGVFGVNLDVVLTKLEAAMDRIEERRAKEAENADG